MMVTCALWIVAIQMWGVAIFQLCVTTDRIAPLISVTLGQETVLLFQWFSIRQTFAQTYFVILW
jgi:hypothetical protein